jgi:Transposase IS116/IS110/IS902 family
MANSSCGAATTDRPAAATRTRPRQVRSARRARGGQGRTAGAAACWSTGRRGALARAEAAGRPPRRPGLGATSLPATAALAPARARPGRGCTAGRTRPGALARPAQPAACSPRADDADTHRTRPRCSLPQPHARAVLELDREVHARTEAIAPRLLELPGCGALSAAKLLCEIGPIDRFRSDAQLARHAGVAPLDASSGKHQRHRLDRGGNRQLDCALHRIAITQGRVHALRGPTSSASRARARAAAKRSAASSDSSPARSTQP